MFSAVIDLAK